MADYSVLGCGYVHNDPRGGHPITVCMYVCRGRGETLIVPVQRGQTWAGAEGGGGKEPKTTVSRKAYTGRHEKSWRGHTHIGTVRLNQTWG